MINDQTNSNNQKINDKNNHRLSINLKYLLINGAILAVWWQGWLMSFNYSAKFWVRRFLGLYAHLI